MVITKCPHCAGPVPYLVEFQGHKAFCTGCGHHFVLEGPVAELLDEREVLVLDLQNKTNTSEANKPKET